MLSIKGVCFSSAIGGENLLRKKRLQCPMERSGAFGLRLIDVSAAIGSTWSDKRKRKLFRTPPERIVVRL